jgi:hypothetical protein
MDGAVTVVYVLAMLFAAFAVVAHGAAVAALGLGVRDLFRAQATLKAGRGRPEHTQEHRGPTGERAE